jgi:hypothetical protein
MRNPNSAPGRWNLIPTEPGIHANFLRWNIIIISILAFLVLGAFVAGIGSLLESNGAPQARFP